MPESDVKLLEGGLDEDGIVWVVFKVKRSAKARGGAAQDGWLFQISPTGMGT
jgi:hypothetical protein